MSDIPDNIEVPDFDKHSARSEELIEKGIEFSEQDLEDLGALGITGGDVPEFHPILEVWREVLKHAPDELDKKVTPQWANRITSSYREINFADMVDLRDALFTKLTRIFDILVEEIATDDECLNAASPEEDVEMNSQHYRNLLKAWQLEMLRWEMQWDTQSPAAAVEIAALSEVHRMVFGSPQQPGITAYLDNIKFEYTEADQADLAAAIEAEREGL